MEGNVTIYYTINGQRTEKRRVNLKVASNQWHTFECGFPGQSFAATTFVAAILATSSICQFQLAAVKSADVRIYAVQD